MSDSKYVRDGEERVLAIYFNTIGFGYVLMKNPLEVLDKGMICITPTCNTKTMQHLKRLVRKLQPERIVIEDHTGKASHKSTRIKSLLNLFERFTKQKGISLSKYSREQITLVFENWHAKNRYDIATVIARNIEAFSNILFEKPKYPRMEHYRSAQFDSASLAVTHYYITH